MVESGGSGIVFSTRSHPFANEVQDMSVLDSVRPAIRNIEGYKPGKQPRPDQNPIKLNTNENPFAPSDKVIAAIHKASGERLRKYPEPSSRPVRESAARAYGLHADQVLVGNGSDDLLTIILRTFIDPGQVVAAPDPTYSLYDTLTSIQGGAYKSVPWIENGDLPIDDLVATGAKVIFVVRPNAPTGHAIPLDQVRTLCAKAPGAVVLDEAYGDFCDDNGLSLLPDCPNLIITRSFSKSYSLAGLRLGMGFMSVELAEQLHKVRDSYNVDALAQAAACAVLDNLEDYKPQLQEVFQQRARMTEELTKRGFSVPPSQANFVLATIPRNAKTGAEWLADLEAKGILIRYFGNHPQLSDKLRISIGTSEEMDACLAAIDAILAE